MFRLMLDAAREKLKRLRDGNRVRRRIEGNDGAGEAGADIYNTQPRRKRAGKERAARVPDNVTDKPLPTLQHPACIAAPESEMNHLDLDLGLDLGLGCSADCAGAGAGAVGTHPVVDKMTQEYSRLSECLSASSRLLEADFALIQQQVSAAPLPYHIISYHHTIPYPTQPWLPVILLPLPALRRVTDPSDLLSPSFM